MYISRNLYDPVATYINLSDQEFFKEALKTATDNYYHHEKELAEDEISDKFNRVKHAATPVFYATTVSKRTADDISRPRVELNDRLRRKFIVLDMDFAATDQDNSVALRELLIYFAKKFHCQLVIYPTPSYPEKPRFRAIVFTGSQLTEKTYWQAAHWLTDMLMHPDRIYSAADVKNGKVDLTGAIKMAMSLSDKFDQGFDKIKSNNNLPVFINQAQVDAVYSNLDDDEFKPLKPSADHLWRSKEWAKKANKQFKRSVKVDQSRQAADDAVKLDADKLLVAAEEYAQTDDAKNYETFWPFVYSLARAVVVGQVGSGTAALILKKVADGAPDTVTQTAWQTGNQQLYQTALDRIQSGKSALTSIRPLIKYPHFDQANITLPQNAKLLSGLLNL